jgi:nucleotide-binding universal stress UspA family protein
MKNILVATDLSERSDRAIDRAVFLANRFDAELTILHVIDDELPTMAADRQQESANRLLMEYLSSLPSSKNHKIKPLTVFGKDWTMILRQAEADKSDVVILGLHRQREIQDLFRGTTVERVVRHGDVPTLIVKNRATQDYRSILIGIDFSVYSRRAIEFALDFAPDAKINLVHAYDIPFRTFLSGSGTPKEMKKRHEGQFSELVLEQMSGFLSGLERNFSGKSISQVITHGDPHDVIREQVGVLGIDLLVMGTHGRTGVAHAVLGSVAESFLTNPPCDVVAVKAW